ncbi:GerW family sporulation protein [Nocardia sp. NPDC052316]|uniref:GerW family sporulation protein n=1 Tax=Nocardia sp. NPDC052316 TaxID=3364329 RepID=UPI0037CB3A94
MAATQEGDPSFSAIDRMDAAISAGLRQQGTGCLGEQARADTVFGEPVTAEGITVIPVARARFGFGRTGSSDGVEGGGVDVRPMGYIEIRNGTACYRRIGNRWSRVGTPLIALASGFAVSGVIRALRKSSRLGIGYEQS